MDLNLLKKLWKEVSYLLKNDISHVLKNLPYKGTLNLDQERLLKHLWLRENDPLDYLVYLRKDELKRSYQKRPFIFTYMKEMFCCHIFFRLNFNDYDKHSFNKLKRVFLDDKALFIR